MAGKTIGMSAVQAFPGKLAQVMTGKTAGCINEGMRGAHGQQGQSGGHTKTDA
jgi:hypothetical protein